MLRSLFRFTRVESVRPLTANRKPPRPTWQGLTGRHRGGLPAGGQGHPRLWRDAFGEKMPLVGEMWLCLRVPHTRTPALERRKGTSRTVFVGAHVAPTGL